MRLLAVACVKQIALLRHGIAVAQAPLEDLIVTNVSFILCGESDIVRTGLEFILALNALKVD